MSDENLEMTKEAFLAKYIYPAAKDLAFRYMLGLPLTDYERQLVWEAKAEKSPLTPSSG
jgi:hypothetical protein